MKVASRSKRAATRPAPKSPISLRVTIRYTPAEPSRKGGANGEEPQDE